MMLLRRTDRRPSRWSLQREFRNLARRTAAVETKCRVKACQHEWRASLQMHQSEVNRQWQLK
jgi:hypothetical protein